MMGHVCQHCRAKFCFRHSMPETHGCSRDAKRQARAGARDQARRIENGVINPSAPLQLKAADRSKLKAKLAKTLEEKAHHSEKKKKNDKKKKKK